MTYTEIIQKCKELGFSNYDYGYGEFDEKVFGEVIEVYRQGGEGKGEDWKRVYHFVDHDVYLSMEGFYSSYNGVDFDGEEPKQVFPREKTITIFE